MSHRFAVVSQELARDLRFGLSIERNGTGGEKKNNEGFHTSLSCREQIPASEIINELQSFLDAALDFSLERFVACESISEDNGTLPSDHEDVRKFYDSVILQNFRISADERIEW